LGHKEKQNQTARQNQSNDCRSFAPVSEYTNQPENKTQWNGGHECQPAKG
jgi:hypothetical protein